MIEEEVRPPADDIWADGGDSVARTAEFMACSARQIYRMIEDQELVSAKVRGRRVVARRSARARLAAGQVVAT